MSDTKKENKDFSFSKENLSLAEYEINKYPNCLLYTSDAADE